LLAAHPRLPDLDELESGLSDFLARARRFACSSATGSPPSSAIAWVQVALLLEAHPRQHAIDELDSNLRDVPRIRDALGRCEETSAT
jgi:hypothetical protein